MTTNATNSESAADFDPSVLPTPEIHPLSAPLNRLLHRLRDVEETIRVVIPIALERRANDLRAIAKDLDAAAEQAASQPGHAPPALAVSWTRAYLRVIRKLERLKNSQIDVTLARSLFIGAFSIFDAFVGELLSTIMTRRPELLDSSKGTIDSVDVMKATSIEDLRASIIARDIETIRREAYYEQFALLEKRFGLHLTKFANWPAFIEAGQRRNLVTHCDAVVNGQYLHICSRFGASIPNDAVLGSVLSIDPTYLHTSCGILREVAAKLSHTLWRKLFPDEREAADKDLNNILFESLQLEDWHWTITMGEFGVGQTQFGGELYQRMMIINLALAWYYKGDKERAKVLLAAHDWTAVRIEFQLAHAVITENLALAITHMQTIGKSMGLVSVHCYHTWPLFRAFRTTPEFLRTYEEIYGHSFVDTVRDKAETDAATISPNVIVDVTEQAGGTPVTAGELAIAVEPAPNREKDTAASGGAGTPSGDDDARDTMNDSPGKPPAD